MSETSAERLEQIKFNTNSKAKMSNPPIYYRELKEGDFRFLIEQAEENERLHKALDGLGKAVEIYSEMSLEDAMKELIELAEEDSK